ncbi:hypothetical protein [Pelagibaculum spongiae]|uniref:DUF86 domain-containing protein n=1 Tax=Pelagibaculum spongiae TaxID=2080658 RepID=A0A2V1GYW7_9GAMM|nr:hypothetical protein [Pelagibaculum spongiae]PVZ71639.1 hypothetical protein DC094_00990 [Pelagibaculum spongiae]
MTEKKIALLKQHLLQMHKAADRLRWSFGRCQLLDVHKLSAEDEEKFETLTARFARLSDILIQKQLRLIDELDLESAGTVRDRINRAEKKGLIDSARDFIVIRELRNAIAHEYEDQALEQIHQQVMQYTPMLLEVPERVEAYCCKIIG